MCLLSVYRPGAPVVREHILRGTYCNPDGFGFAVIVGDRIEIGKGMDAEAVVAAFIAVREAHPDGWAMFHSRLTTDGETTTDNCHPFIVGGDARTVLGHNGILPAEARPRGKDKRSDTRILAERLIPVGMFGSLRSRRGRKALGKWIAKDGYPNKVAILTVDPRYRERAFIIGEQHGTWVGDVWHSNGGYQSYAERYPRTVSVGSKLSDGYYAYLDGKISYADYLDGLYTGKSAPVLATNACPSCLSAGEVDVNYGYCRDCKVCLDCGDEISWCTCFDASSSGYPASVMADVLPMALAELAERELDERELDENGDPQS